jgi:retinol dehydrogenase-14
MEARVAIVGRSAERAEHAARAIGAAGGGKVDVLVADMSSQSQVRRLAEEILQSLPRIDVLVNNVGGYWNSRHVTADGLERTFALNHFAPFLLTNLLLDRLTRSSPARVVTVSSQAHARGRIQFAGLQGESSYSGARAYGQSSSPTSCSPTNWPEGYAAAGSPQPCFTPVWCARRSEPRTRAASSGCSFGWQNGS